MSDILQPWHILIVGFSSWINRQQAQVLEYVTEENRVMRELLDNKRPRFNDDQRRRLAAKAKKLGRKALRELGAIVTPNTLLRRHRKLIARKYDYSHRRGPGRPRIPIDVQKLVVKLAIDNPAWGYDRLEGAMSLLGYSLDRNTIGGILREHGVGPAPTRSRQTSWKAFLKAHWNVIAAADFFTVEIWSRFCLVRYHFLFTMKLCTRWVEVLGIKPEPDGPWMHQIARNATDCEAGFLRDKRFLIVDRDPLFTRQFGEILKAAGVQLKRLPTMFPNLNAYAERFVRFIKQGCLNRMIFFGEQPLWKAVTEYVTHYNQERPHQGIGNHLIEPVCTGAPRDGPIACQERLGGVLRFYYRKAA